MDGEKNRKKYRIGTLGIIFWVSFAAVADLLSLIPIVGDFTGPIFFFCFSIYLWKVGCGFLNGRRLATEVIAMVGEMIPLVQELPITLAGAIAVIIMVRMEDKTGLKLPGTATSQGTKTLNKDGTRMPPQRQASFEDINPENTGKIAPLNQDGIRPPRVI